MTATTTTKVAILGSNGQLGQELQATLPEHIEWVGGDVESLDITHASQVTEWMQAEQPDIAINAAAYTAVDQAENDAETAMAVNRDGARHIAIASQAVGARLFHVSTDFVFSGQAATPYTIDTPINNGLDAVNVYGRSKAEGELAVQQACPSATIIRTAWVYSQHGHNFVFTILRLLAERPALSIVADQIGTPTWAKGLAKAIWQMSDLPPADTSGMLHYTDSGVASWYDFAVAIQEEACVLGLLPVGTDKITPQRTADYPTPATRPSYSVLDKTATWALLGEPRPHWRVQLRNMLQAYAATP